MPCSTGHTKTVEVSLETKNQTREKLMEALDAVLRQSGTIECGLIAEFAMTFGERSERKVGSDPEPELKKHGVTSVKTSKG